MIYDELATELEEAWTKVGLHEHLVVESIVPDVLERAYRAELFPDPPESFMPEAAPPWVEVSFSWRAEHQVYSERSEGRSISLELAWTYTVDVRSQADRNDTELIRAFHAAVHVALQRITPDIPQETEYVAVEVRRGYRSIHTNPTLAYVQMIGTNVTDLGNLWDVASTKDLRGILHSECSLVMSVLQSLKEVFVQ
ncbi:MAG: hypothetical protein GFH27_549289n249 [Chloroflexi bacterium AL-W]|nr:hypothetical protein [Chloroflexi bacterium AL-N1]NOK66981.1 hypothetical protein [Chloroflexi bacterium AL-N10]NOK74727.1 hypothetical protein [Chloroflexi bacterium AL-N5]NOK81583.1 hypothetical protein [Chloroflexi bacterium AL-W]NOK89053.1 hypothetical protein [Chloroflexi bacterium AL-N15]